MTTRKKPCEKAVEAARLFGLGKSLNDIKTTLGLRDKEEARNKVAEGQRK